MKGHLRTGAALTWRQRLCRTAGLVYNLVTLPLGRAQLNILALQSPRRLASLPHMAHEAAASPTPQEEP